MYTAIIFILLGLSALLIIRGVRRRKTAGIISGVALAILSLGFFKTMDIWADYLWFDALDFGGRFWTFFWAEVVSGAGGLLAAGLATALLLRLAAPGAGGRIRTVTTAIGALLGLLWGLAHWGEILRFWHRESAGIAEPVLGHDAGFYLFTLPLLDGLLVLGILVVLATAGGSLAALFGAAGEINRTLSDKRPPQLPANSADRLIRLGAMALAGAAAAIYLRTYHLLYSTWGAVSGPGWTDVHIRIPAFYIGALITLAAAVALAVPALRNRLVGRFGGDQPGLRFLGAASVGMVTVYVLLFGIAPSLVQWLIVEPNEITYEKPYIANNIEFTRHGFHLHEVEEREFPAIDTLSRASISQNPAIIENIRLWDWRALDAVYRQFQEIRLYYEFVDVDIDRYHLSDGYRQVMVAARELEFSNLPEQSRTFVNRRFKYTHGYGLTMTNVSEFTPEGLPNLLIQDIPPRHRDARLAVERPEIYYGELTDDYVVVNSAEEEFDYPSGESNAYTRYAGEGGVSMGGLWRKFLFGYKFNATQLFLSSYPTADSRIMFNRSIHERVRTLAPFLEFDDDPYIVLADGRLYWMVDAYTTSRYFPYSEPFSPEEVFHYRDGMPHRSNTMARHLGGVNYIRNSVKVVVDAYNGKVSFYVFDESDPLVRVWRNIFPDLFNARSEMPESLRSHVRYPVDYLLVQGKVYSKYHMSDPAVFYNQEDLWVRATEKYYDRVQPIEPYYVMWEMPDSDEPSFVLILPFTPKNRQVMIGWIAGMCDGDDYGRFLAYKFPKEKRVLGPQQVETKIDQDSFLSGQLSLWDQRGSKVIRGNVLAIPIDRTLLYVEPIYLQAETAAYPELRLVAVMHNDNLSYAPSFQEALAGLFEGRERPDLVTQAAMDATPMSELAARAQEQFDAWLKAQGDRRFDDAADALSTLAELLEQMARRSGDTPAQQAAPQE